MTSRSLPPQPPTTPTTTSPPAPPTSPRRPSGAPPRGSPGSRGFRTPPGTRPTRARPLCNPGAPPPTSSRPAAAAAAALGTSGRRHRGPRRGPTRRLGPAADHARGGVDPRRPPRRRRPGSAERSARPARTPRPRPRRAGTWSRSSGLCASQRQRQTRACRVHRRKRQRELASPSRWVLDGAAVAVAAGGGRSRRRLLPVPDVGRACPHHGAPSVTAVMVLGARLWQLLGAKGSVVRGPRRSRRRPRGPLCPRREMPGSCRRRGWPIKVVAAAAAVAMLQRCRPRTTSPTTTSGRGSAAATQMVVAGHTLAVHGGSTTRKRAMEVPTGGAAGRVQRPEPRLLPLPSCGTRWTCFARCTAATRRTSASSRWRP